MAKRLNKMKNKMRKENPINIALKNIKIFIIGLLTYILLFWLFPIYSFIALFLIIGLIILAINGHNEKNIYLGGLIGFWGSLAASIFLTVDKYIYYVNTMPIDANPDIPMSLYTNTLFNLVKLTPLSFINPFLFIVISTLLCAAFTQLGLLKIKNIKNIVAYACISILAINFLFVSIYSSRDLVQYASVEPPNLSYAYDAIGYLKTIYLMNKEGYYKALVEAEYNDARRNKDKTWTARGAQPGTTRLVIRNPFIFYLWKYISMGNASRVVYFSIYFCAALLILSYFSARRLIGEFSILIPILIMPFIFLGTTWANVFFPDWWAGLFMFATFLLWILKKYWLASLFLLMSLLSREMIAFSYIIFLISALHGNRKALKPLLVTGILFATLFALNYINASQAMAAGKPSATSINNIAPFFGFHFIPTSSYLMFLYGFFKIPIYILFLFALVSSIVYKQLEIILFVSYSFFHDSLASSSYWGNHFMLIIIFSLSLLLNFEPKKLLMMIRK